MSDSCLFKILYYRLDKGSSTAPELTAAFEISSRTIYRDIEALSGAGIPVYTEPGRNGGISLLHRMKMRGGDRNSPAIKVHVLMTL